MQDNINETKSGIERFWEFIQFSLVRILVAMGTGFIIASILNPAGTSRMIGMILYNPHFLSNEFKLGETWILLGFGLGLIIFGILLYTFMYLTEYHFRLFLQKLRKNQIKEIYRRGHSQLLELQFIITISFLITFIASRAIVVAAGESKPSLELWVGNYNVHHFFFGLLLLSISGWISLVESQKKYKKISAISA